MSEKTTDRLPSILIVDDKPEEVRQLEELLRGQASTVVRHPQDVTNDDLVGTDLVLVDYRLQHWPERDEIYSLSLRPMNGLALAGVLRAFLTHEESEEAGVSPGPTAIALHSALLKQLAGGLPVEIRVHAIARANNLEWAFEKSVLDSSLPPLSDQLTSLADAVCRLPNTWPREPESVKELAKEFFQLPSEAPWASQAWSEIEDCHPPLHELSTATHGLALIRWMLHRILPYPCFLFDEWHLAARLGVEHAGFHAALKNANFVDAFKDTQYAGSLSTFLGKRWWRAGVESLLWELTEAQSYDLELARQRLSERTGVALTVSRHSNPIVCLDAHYKALPTFCSADESVRIQPDDWPSFAEQAWTTVALAREHALLNSLVIGADRKRLGSSGEESLGGTEDV